MSDETSDAQAVVPPEVDLSAFSSLAQEYVLTPADDAEDDLTHDALALRMGQDWSDARYVAAWNRWYFYDGSHWVEDTQLEHLTRTRDYLRRRAVEVVKSTAESAKKLDDPKAGERLRKWGENTARSLRQSITVAAVASMARSNRSQAASVGQWDADPYALGTPEGTVDLRTGRIRKSLGDDYITRCTAVSPAPPGATPSLWLSFLDRITGEDPDLLLYLQRYAGYALTGSVEEHAFAFGYGTGANGKSVFLETLQRIMGTYSATIPTEILMATPNERHPTELARLRGVRLAVGSETEQGKRWAEARIKALTGGDVIVARFMREDFFEFQPTFKLFVVGNHRPALRGIDEAMRRRLHFIPFEVTIPPEERDLRLREKLQEEWPAILRWMIDGCLQWQEEGLNAPAAVRAATDIYFSQEDTWAAWAEECCTPMADAWEPSGALFASWKRWAETNGEFVGTKKRFGQVCEERGLQGARKHGGVRGFMGLRLSGAENASPSASSGKSWSYDD